MMPKPIVVLTFENLRRAERGLMEKRDAEMFGTKQWANAERAINVIRTQRTAILFMQGKLSSLPIDTAGYELPDVQEVVYLKGDILTKNPEP